jgi:small-conductance mechanosensitive channel
MASTFKTPAQLGWFGRAFEWAPPWVGGLIVLAAAVAVGVVLHGLAAALVRRLLRSRDEFWGRLVARTRHPTRLAFALAAVIVASPLAPFTRGQAHLLRQALFIGIILLIGWAVLVALDIGAALYMRRFREEAPDSLVARKHLTQVRVLRRAASVLIVLLTIALALMTIPGVRQWGVTLLATGGAAGIILGLSLQPLLSNLLAGVQLATTQPVRIDDQVVVEGEWGTVEEITSTYIVVRIWDERRLVLPLTYFLQKPFQNWTRQSTQLLGTAMLYVDYAVPVQAVRDKLAEILKGSPLWDGRVSAVQVTDLRERTVEIRCLVSAADAGKLFDLRCLVREQMVGFLQSRYPHALPRVRLDVSPAGIEPVAGPDGRSGGEAAGNGAAEGPHA